MREREHVVYEVSRRHARGEGIRAIARALGIARKTVRRMLTELEERRTQGDDALAREMRPKRVPRGSKLDRFEGEVRRLLELYPDIRATRVHEELVARGFDGSYTIVRERLNALRVKPAKKPAQVVRTPPGVQGQFDWSPYRLADKTRIYAFACVLSYSRYPYMRFTPDSKQPTTFRQLRRAFECCGGVASQYVTDSMPGIVDRWELGEPVLNLRAVDFAAHYGFSYHIAPRGRGDYKGKVERYFRTLWESFFNGRTLHSLEQANEALETWLDHRVRTRRRTTTSSSPAELLAEELPTLRPLPAQPFDDREVAHRLVDPYGYVHFDGNLYAAKAGVGVWVFVRADDREVEILGGDAGSLVRYPRAPRGQGLRSPEPAVDTEPARRRIPDLLERFRALGEGAHRFAERVREVKRYAGVELGRILTLQETYYAEDLIAAIAHAASYAAYDAASVERILKAKALPRTPESRMAEAARDRIRRAMADHPVRQRSLADYAPVFEGSPPHAGATPAETRHDQDEAPGLEALDGGESEPT